MLFDFRVTILHIKCHVDRLGLSEHIIISKTRVPKTHYRYLTISVRTRTAAVEIPVRLRLHAWVLQYHARWTTGKRFADETKLSITAAYMQNVSPSFYNILLPILYVTLLHVFRYHIIIFCRSII